MMALRPLLLLISLFAGASLASTCISRPANLQKGEICGGSIFCKRNYYCGKEGVCIAQSLEGEACENDDQCISYTFCKGPEGAKRCRASVSPGKTCSDNEDEDIPYCGTQSCQDGVCVDGDLGDSCVATSNCRNGLTCTNQICTGAAVGQACTSNQGCALGSFCNGQTDLCQALPTAGNCSASVGCAYGYTCQRPSLNANYRLCYADATVGDGQYCEGDSVCSSLRCVDNYCAKGSPKACEGSTGCSLEDVCTCGGSVLFDGFGTCQKNPCFKSYKAAMDCLGAHCRLNSFRFFDGSCSKLNCNAELTKYFACNPAPISASSLLLVASLALLSLLLPSRTL